MKYLFFAPIALFLCSFALESDLKSPESVPAYTVQLLKRDANIPAGTAQVIFTFNSSSYGLVTSDSIRMSYNGTEVKVATTPEGKSYLGLKAGKYTFQFYYNSEHYEINTDSINVKEGWQTGITVNFENSRVPVIAEKPVIYVYPDATKQISIQLGVNGNIGFTYPLYNHVKEDGRSEEGWSFTADPDGTIHMNGKEYDYLFWDAKANISVTNAGAESGFVVKRDSLVTFLEEKLTAMGLNAREREDFITYWAPQMQNTENCFIHFLFTEEYDDVATINITPKPDQLFRVFMLWDDAAQLDETSVHEQKIESFNRTGFTVVEWGGARTQFISTHQSVN